MTDIDLSAAVEAAESASLLDRRWSIAAIHVTAAAPLIEAAVREQVAREIEARRVEYDRMSREITRGNPSTYDQGTTDAYDLAARIARTGA